MIYAKIKLNIGGTYLQPLSELGVLIDEIKNAAAEKSMLSCWNIQLVEMSEEEYKTIPEFEGH